MAQRKTLVHLRFDEQSIDVPPSDAIGTLADLAEATGQTPTVVDAFTGRGRRFLGEGCSLQALDVIPGGSLATRDCTIDAILKWDIAGQAAHSPSPGTLVARGIGGAPAEYTAYGVELRVINLAQRICETRFTWLTTAGVAKVQRGGHFILPVDGFLYLTATRRWVSSSEVELQYYLGDQLIGDHVSPDGDIGGGTTGTFRVGHGSPGGTYFVGIIDELRVRNYHVTREEVEATWARLSKFQPRGYKAVRDLLQPEAPLSNDPASRIQKLLRIAGHAIGYAAAQAENVRLNQLPDRAYGPVLEEWEHCTGEAPRASDSTDRRRKRVVAHFSQREGVSPPGVRAATHEVLATAKSQLEIIAFDNTVREDFSAGLKSERWMVDPVAQWTINAGALRVQNAASIPFDNTSRSWYTALLAADIDGRASQLITKLTPTTLAAGAEVGVVFYDWTKGNALLFGLKNDAGTYRIITEAFVAWASQGVVNRHAFGALPANLWLHLKQNDPGAGGGGYFTGATDANYIAAWSTTSQTSGYTATAPFAHRSRFQWAGLYARTTAGAANIDVAIDDVLFRTPFACRTSRFYVYRDPALPGAPDLIAAHGVLQRMKHAFTDATAITSKSLLADTAQGAADRGPAGAL